ncbi:Metacaspase-7 [Planktothrix tepida]|uniref:Peptidase C14, caspase catalytic subunit p20 n=1 Tax=Planktothrix tepida PCC 9214 TaxID=671072 RepID=A0A1J1LRF0_9CYAN|nr:caspase family protein [Planktothrix tepida]CAD5968047.1 Metacaspase-7 [Planktothrix tepida]CUR35168.1 Peptidase C14, caspase catalytic subunit p20 [Planktothrix tepida PCC 9214]
MGLKRREFLQQAGLLMAALGIQERLYERSYQALAQPTRRKLALLVGINQYPSGNRIEEPLQGCLTDVELQRNLLMYKFGFQPDDILTLTNQAATRNQIESAFISHLIEQAQMGDVVLFHFSGYGSCIPRNDVVSNLPQIQYSYLPVDAEISEQETVNDILEDTLWLLLRSLPTSEVITVLDTSFIYPGYHQQGTLKIRAASSPTTLEINPTELDLQQQLLSRFNLSQPELEHRKPGQLPGLVLAASKPSQVATEGRWDGFNAGLFTYTLTQAFWGASPFPNLTAQISRVAGEVEQMVGPCQQPQLRRTLNPTKADSDVSLGSLWLPSLPLDGVITGVEENGKTAQVSLTGLPTFVLDSLGLNTILTIISESNSLENPVYLQLRSRAGLKAKAQIKTTDLNLSFGLEVGQKVQEFIRIFPRQINLKIALDPQLNRIERVDATSAFSGFSRMTIVASDQPADYLLSRVTDRTIAQALNAPLSPIFQGRYGLFSKGSVLLPDTIGEGGEAVKVAVHRLIPQLKTRLAIKLLRLTENERSSQLKVRATLNLLAPQSQVLIKRETTGILNKINRENAQSVNSISTLSSSFPLASENLGIVTVPVGSRLQYQLQNQGEFPVYFLLFYVNSEGQTYLFHSGFDPQQQQIAPGKSMSVPPTTVYGGNSSTEIIGELVKSPAGLAETQVILSQNPFLESLTILDKSIKKSEGLLKFNLISNPLDIADAILQDLNRGSQQSLEKIGVITDDLALDINSWATFNFVYRVVG